MNASDLSQLMFAYGYTRDDAETVLQALNDNKPLFRDYFIKALYDGLDQPKSFYDLNRDQGEMNAYEWIRYAEQNGLTLATGESDTKAEKGKFGWDDVVAILGTVGGITESIFGGKKAGEYLTQYQLQAEAERAARQTTTVAIALVIIAVIIAGVVIVTKRK